MKVCKKFFMGLLTAATLGATMLLTAVPAFASPRVIRPEREESSVAHATFLITQDRDNNKVYLNQYLNGNNVEGALPFGITAFVNPNGKSGRIEIDASKAPENYTIDKIGKTKLSDIIRFADGTTVDSITFGKAGFPESISYDYQCKVHTSNGSFLNSNKISFKDTDGTKYTMTMNMSALSNHTIGYNSDTPKIMLITWQS